MKPIPVVVAALVAASAAGCVGELPPDASLADRDHPANPAAPAASRLVWADPFAATSPTSAPAAVEPAHHHGHGGAR